MLAGVLLGFQLDGYLKQRSMDNATTARLHVVYLESEYNFRTGKEMYGSYTDTESSGIYLKRLDDYAARAAFQDENILHLISPYQLSLIRSYIDGINTVNATSELYVYYSGTVEGKITSGGKDLRNSIKENALTFLALCAVLQQELRDFFDKRGYDQKDIKTAESRIKQWRENLKKDLQPKK